MTLRLHSRLVVWNLLVIGLISSILGYFLNQTLREHMQREAREYLRAEGRLAAAYFAAADPAISPDDRADELGQLLTSKVTLFDLEGGIAGDSDLEGADLKSAGGRMAPEVQQALMAGFGYDVRRNPERLVDYSYAAIRLDSYVLRLARPLSVLDFLMSRVRAQLAIASLIAGGLTLVFGYLVRGLISRPLREISAASRKLAAGDLKQRLPVTGDEEIAALGSSLNTMAENLNTKVSELSEGKQRLELIVGAMSQGVMVLDKSGRISLTNRSMREILGAEHDLAGKTPLEVFRRPELENTVRRILAGASSEVLEIPTSTNRVLQANVAPVVDSFGVVDSVVIVFHDLTDIKRTERMRRDFVANVSHEFKTPLTSIRGYAETLLGGAREDPRIAADFLKIIERNARHLESLVSDLLMLGRFEAQMPASKELVDVRTMIDEQISARQAILASREIRVSVECEPAGLQADRARLATALSNLIDNAIHYNKPAGEIRITGWSENGTFNLAVADSGQGIPHEELPRIFERFYRVDKARSRESGGTGLGLSIVKHAIESQGGNIHVTSRLGSGSVFVIKLPMPRESVEP